MLDVCILHAAKQHIDGTDHRYRYYYEYIILTLTMLLTAVVFVSSEDNN